MPRRPTVLVVDDDVLIAISATTAFQKAQKGDFPDGRVFLPKPYSDAAIIAAISQLADERVAAPS